MWQGVCERRARERAACGSVFWWEAPAHGAAAPEGMCSAASFAHRRPLMCPRAILAGILRTLLPTGVFFLARSVLWLCGKQGSVPDRSAYACLGFPSCVFWNKTYLPTSPKRLMAVTAAEAIGTSPRSPGKPNYGVWGSEYCSRSFQTLFELAPWAGTVLVKAKRGQLRVRTTRRSPLTPARVSEPDAPCMYPRSPQACKGSPTVSTSYRACQDQNSCTMPKPSLATVWKSCRHCELLHAGGVDPCSRKQASYSAHNGERGRVAHTAMPRGRREVVHWRAGAAAAQMEGAAAVPAAGVLVCPTRSRVPNGPDAVCSPGFHRPETHCGAFALRSIAFFQPCIQNRSANRCAPVRSGSLDPSTPAVMCFTASEVPNASSDPKGRAVCLRDLVPPASGRRLRCRLENP